VARDANKIQVKQAVEAIFNVKVDSIRTLRVHGKPKRMGRYAGHRSDWKKAIVTLKKGQTIELFEQV
jgi:large subunit ribosomal protein L23